ncbi:MAG: HD domain-containing protein [Defluviitaleaceae bacterium]|nr:HD domain-containing protein [Defluviitaleaceae bacterium]
MENRLEVLRLEVDRLIFENQQEKVRFYIEHLYSVSRYCALLAKKRGLNIEIAMAAGMLHDIANVNGCSGDHALEGAGQAEALLAATGLYSRDEIKLITTAISRHSDKNETHEPYDELLKDADVMSHCFYNPEFPISKWELGRYISLLEELGLQE